MDQSVTEFVSSPHFFRLLMFGGVMLIAALSIIGGCIRSVVASRSNERFRREIAAYIAEGTMTAEQGERILGGAARTGRMSRSSCGWNWWGC